MIPPEVSWQAREIAEAGEPKCLRCALTQRHYFLDDGVTCRATSRLLVDCGARDHLETGEHQPDTGDLEPSSEPEPSYHPVRRRGKGYPVSGTRSLGRERRR